MKNTGLKELPKDDRDFQLGAIFDLPFREVIPDNFRLEQPKVKNQGASDYCSAFATTSMSEIQEGVELSPLYSFALGKSITKDSDAWGQDLRTAMKAHVKFGDIPERIAEFKVPGSLGDKGLRDLDMWKGGYKDIRGAYRKKTYFKVTGPYKPFDNIRSAIWKFREQKQAVALGVLWSWKTDDKFLTVENSKRGTFGHALFILGWDTIGGETYLVAQNSFGEGAGEGGLHHVSRDIINNYAEKYGAFMMVDLDPEEARQKISSGIQEGDGWLVQIIKRSFSKIKTFISKR